VTFISHTADLWFFSVFACLFGLVFGSFLNVCIYRLPRGMSVVSPRSACPGCLTPIAAYDNIPVLSWMILGGRCRSCRKPISPRYWIVELLTGLLFIVCVLRFGVNLDAIKFCAFSFLVLGLIFTDADTQLLPDKMTIPGIWIGLLLSPVTAVGGGMGHLLALGQFKTEPHLVSIANSVAGALVGAGFIYLIGELWYRFRGVEAMGFGDVKLMGMVGAFLGPKLTMLTIFFGSMFGSIAGITIAGLAYRKRLARWRTVDRETARARASQAVQTIMRRFPIPFGVFLGVGALISAFFGEHLLVWYGGLFQ
jgi:leader peptidase (prepilin peptidase)/N-methyltransferase